MKSENKNFLYNVIYQIFIFIVPLITTPYISRVLGASNIGIYSYTYSIVYYFMLATMLGINNYGARTIAKSKTKERMSYSFCSIYYLQLICGVLMLVIYNLLILFVFKQYKLFFFVQNIYLVSAIMDINWLYFGLEKFKITISRNIIIKICSLVFIFLFVKGENDLVIYTIIVSASTLLSQLYLWLFVKKNIDFVKVKFIDIIKNLKPCIILFIPSIAYGIYRVMDKTMLGYMSGTTVLGYYENAEKIINIPISFINALGTVMLPSASKVTESTDELLNKIKSSFKLCLCFVMPMVFALVLIGNDFALIFFGDEFKDSGTIIQCLAITILFSAIANVIRTNYLIPKERDKIYVVSTVIGAIVNFIVNLSLIPHYGYVGACIGTILAEFLVMLFQFIVTKKEIKLGFIYGLLFNYAFKSIIMIGVMIVLGQFIDNILLKLIVQIVAGILVYFLLNYNFVMYDFFAFKKKKK